MFFRHRMAAKLKKEVVQLRRFQAGSGQHGMHLAAMMDLMLEKVQKRRADRFLVCTVRASFMQNGSFQIRFLQSVAEPDEPLIFHCLRRLELVRRFKMRGLVYGQSLALLAQRIEIVTIDLPDMVEGLAKGRKEVCPLRLECALRESATGLMEPFIGVGIVAGHQAEMFKKCSHGSALQVRPHLRIPLRCPDARRVDVLRLVIGTGNVERQAVLVDGVVLELGIAGSAARFPGFLE